MTIRRRTLTGTVGYGVAGVAAVTALVAGCSSAASSSSSSTPASGPSTPTTSATPAASAASSAAGAPTASASPASSPGTSSTASGTSGTAGGPPACPTRSLKVTTGTAQGAAGSVYQAIDFTSTSSAACTLYGYPGVALMGGSPLKQIGAAATRSTQTAAKLVTLEPGQTANALLRVVDALNYPESTCHPVASAYLQIYPPNQTTPVYLAYKSTACSSTSVKLLSVSVVQPGSGS